MIKKVNDKDNKEVLILIFYLIELIANRSGLSH